MVDLLFKTLRMGVYSQIFVLALPSQFHLSPFMRPNFGSVVPLQTIQGYTGWVWVLSLHQMMQLNVSCGFVIPVCSSQIGLGP